jgi:ribonuclease HI
MATAAKSKRRSVDFPEEDALNIYTDGSMLPAPRRGGTGMILALINDEGKVETYEPFLPGYMSASNNAMELKACVEALKLATAQQPYFEPHRYRKIIVFTDSMYVAGYHEAALYTWSQNGWLDRNGGLVSNATEWQDLVRLIKRARGRGKQVEFRWVRGKTTPMGKRVDKRAKASAEAPLQRQVRPARIRRKRTRRPMERGSVRMEGQRLTIRIVKEEFQAVQRVDKLSYEVLSKASPFRGCFDVIFANPSLNLRAGHCYYVRVNEDTGNPRIEKVFREVACDATLTDLSSQAPDRQAE